MRRGRKQVSSHIQVLKGFMKDHPEFNRLFPEKSVAANGFEDSFKASLLYPSTLPVHVTCIYWLTINRTIKHSSLSAQDDFPAEMMMKTTRSKISSPFPSNLLPSKCLFPPLRMNSTRRPVFMTIRVYLARRLTAPGRALTWFGISFPSCNISSLQTPCRHVLFI